MRITNPLKHGIFFYLPVLLALLEAGCNSDNPGRSKVCPITYQHIVRRDPNFSIYVVTVDLNDPRVTARVSRGGPAPQPGGMWNTTLMPVREIAEREKFDIAVNGDFYIAQATVDIEGRNTGYVRGKLASPEGPAMTDGLLWHKPIKDRAYLCVYSNHLAQFFAGGNPATNHTGMAQIIGGSQLIVLDGKPVEFMSKFATNRNPRTVVGLDRTGTRMTLMVVDGRQPKLSIGMTLHELSDEMIRLGCDSAINLDGGGSTTLVYRDPATHQPKVVNSPSDTKERSVADALGITVNGEIPAPD